MRNSIWVLELLVIWQLPTGTVPCKNIRFRDRSLFIEGGGGKNKEGAICINKLLEGGTIKFFQENEWGGVAIKFEGICLISMVSIWL